MTGHRLEVADVFRAFQEQFFQRWGHALSDQQRKVLRDIGLCRTAALGTHLERCDRCSYETLAFDSCRNRHCPKCQSSARDRWLLKQAAGLLPVPYVHAVFTVPEQLTPMALRNQKVFYSILFRAASETLLDIAADPRHLGARIGILAVLHTWSQNLQFHPHLHCLIPAGGLAPDHSRWIATKRYGFFLPVRVLSRMFRGKLLSFLKRSYRSGELCFPGKLAALGSPRTFYSLLGSLRRKEWVVYSKPPFGGPEHVLKYLARYTHRVAISNGRLLSLEDGQIRFRWRDSRHNNRSSVMRLDAAEFIRRFLLHVLPAGFVKIRHFGICGGGGYAINATMTERRIKALGTVTAANYGRLMRGNFSGLHPVDAMEKMAKQRTAEVRGAKLQVDDLLPPSVEAGKKAGITDIDVLEATDYYRTPRGQKPNGLNRSMPSHQAAAVGWDAFNLAEVLLTQPMCIVVGGKPGAFGAYRDGCEIVERAALKDKELVVAEGWSHYDLYDKPEPVKIALDKLIPFYTRVLGTVEATATVDQKVGKPAA